MNSKKHRFKTRPEKYHYSIITTMTLFAFVQLTAFSLTCEVASWTLQLILLQLMNVFCKQPWIWTSTVFYTDAFWAQLWERCRLCIVSFNITICFQIEIRCTKDGEWTAEFTMCPNLQGSCSAPPDLNSVEYSCDHGMAVGELNHDFFLNSDWTWKKSDLN